MKFGYKSDTAGSLGYSGQPTGDNFAFYATGPSDQSGCGQRGYLYHVRSGLCVTAVAPFLPVYPKYNGAVLQLYPCGSFSSAPQEAQSFCGSEFFLNTGSIVAIAFKGDIPDAGMYYGSNTGPNSNSVVTLRAFGSAGITYWYYTCPSVAANVASPARQKLSRAAYDVSSAGFL